MRMNPGLGIPPIGVRAVDLSELVFRAAAVVTGTMVSRNLRTPSAHLDGIPRRAFGHGAPILPGPSHHCRSRRRSAGTAPRRRPVAEPAETGRRDAPAGARSPAPASHANAGRRHGTARSRAGPARRLRCRALVRQGAGCPVTRHAPAEPARSFWSPFGCTRAGGHADLGAGQRVDGSGLWPRPPTVRRSFGSLNRRTGSPSMASASVLATVGFTMSCDMGSGWFW